MNKLLAWFEREPMRYLIVLMLISATVMFGILSCVLSNGSATVD